LEIADPSGKVVATAVSNWVRMNGRTVKMETIGKDVALRYEPEPDRTNYDGDGWLKKLPAPEAGAYTKPVCIDRNFIDANHHMNNIFYMDMVNMVLPEEVFRAPQADTFEIMFRRAIGYGETVQCHYAEEPDAHVVFIRSEDDSQLRTVIRLHRTDGKG
jgi:acyl-ACP thioesterase